MLISSSATDDREINTRYAQTLVHALNNQTTKPVRIAEPSTKIRSHEQVVYPSAIAPKHLLNHLPLVHYKALAQQHDSARAAVCKEVALWLQPMQAGIGSTIERRSYLSKMWNKPQQEVRLGAKGCDLHITIAHNGQTHQVSLAEVQLLRALQLCEQQDYAEIIYSDLISDKTADAVANLLRKPIAGFGKGTLASATYEEVFAQLPRVHYFAQAAQNAIPALEEGGQVSAVHSAPGGHGFFGFRALLAAIDPTLRPTSSHQLVSMICNGEDLSPKPLAAIVEWMVTEEIPIAMITTTKTAVDSKGGQIALLPGENNHTYQGATIVELAQAEQADQRELFVQLGLRPGDQAAYFNTNTVLLNYKVLSPLLQKLHREIGDREFSRIIAPTVIKNKKERIAPNGSKQSYTQLEGALGSVMLNADRYMRQRFGIGLVHFINIDVDDRLRFFAPIKNSFDFYRLFFADCFRFDGESLSFVPLAPVQLPHCSFSDPAYGDVDFVLEAFRDCSIAALQKLQVEGKVKFTGALLAGTVHIRNAGDDCVDLNTVVELRKYRRNGRLYLRDVEIILPRREAESRTAQAIQLSESPSF